MLQQTVWRNSFGVLESTGKFLEFFLRVTEWHFRKFYFANAHIIYTVSIKDNTLTQLYYTAPLDPTGLCQLLDFCSEPSRFSCVWLIINWGKFC